MEEADGRPTGAALGTYAERKTERSLSLLRATLESTADGILVVVRDGDISAFNRTFVRMWNIPEDVIAKRDAAAALSSVLEQLTDPSSFLKKVKELYAHPDSTSFDVLHFKDGRVFERYSQPQRVDGLADKLSGSLRSSNRFLINSGNIVP